MIDARTRQTFRPYSCVNCDAIGAACGSTHAALDAAKAEVKYPNIQVQLTGKDGNAFAIIGAVQRALFQAGVSRSELIAFRNESFASSDYNALLRVAMSWVDVA